LLVVALTSEISIVKAYPDPHWAAANLYTTNWLTTDQEAAYVTDALNQIRSNFSVQFLYHYYFGPYTVYGQLTNWGTSTTPSTVLGQIDYTNAHYYFSTVLYIGHGVDDGFFGYASDPNNQNVCPNETYYYGGNDNVLAHTQSVPYQQFVFNWVCSAGDTVWLVDNGQNIPPPYWGAPYDWNPLFWAGQANGADYCWIGFNGSSPWLKDIIWDSTTNMHYGTWLEDFYWYALVNGYLRTTVLQALDMASYLAGFPNYGSSSLATGYYSYWPYSPNGTYSGCMVIAGDPNEYLPAWEILFP